MNFSSDYSFPEKVYLSGADCFFLMLEKNTKKHACGNNVIRICFSFDTKKEADFLIERMQCSPFIHWLNNIELVRSRFYIKPYWKYVDKGKTIPLYTLTSSFENELPKELLNRAIPLTSSQLIECDCVHYPSGKISVVLSWHHILMDGRGSGMLLRHLSGQLPYNENAELIFFPKKEKRSSLYAQIRNMYKVKHFIQRSSKGPIASPMREEKDQILFGLKTVCFDANETQLIDEFAVLNGARFGANNFLIAACAQTVNQLNLKRGIKGVVWVPIPYDGRKRGAKGPLITNFISFLFYRFEKDHFESISSTVRRINDQMTEQLNMEMPKKYNLLLDMMRHIPTGLYHLLATRSSKGAVSSFLFTSAGEGIWDMKKLMEHPFSDVAIIPPFTFPPGLTFSFLRINNSLKMNIVYAEHCFDQNELNFIVTKLRSILVENKL